MPDQKRQVGGSKEALLAVVGNSEFDVIQQPPIKQDYTPEDTEIQNYRQLLQGFFEKLMRWNDICEDQKYKRKYLFFEKDEDKFRDFYVLQTRIGRIITPSDPPVRVINRKYEKEKQRRILAVTRYIALNHSEDHAFNKQFTVRPEQAGKHLLVDPEGRPIREATFEINDQKLPSGAQSKSLKIRIEYTPPDNHTPSDYKDVYYQVGRGQIKISQIYSPRRMPESYQTHLFNTVDALIPGNTSSTSQLGRRASQETQTPKALPASRRRTPRG